MRQGTEGCVQDYRVFGGPWGFELESISAPVHLWEGTEDHTGPLGYRDFLLHHIPRSTFIAAPGEGHISLLTHRAEAILGRLIAPETYSQSAESMAR
jgi:pimeloyl-ACP methyl ester carboxylesterase